MGIKRVNEMAKNIQTKGSTARSKSATKPLARARTAETKRPVEKKVRRTIFKTDQWYENAAMSIGIVSRSKGGRPGAAVATARTKDHGD